MKLSALKDVVDQVDMAWALHPKDYVHAIDALMRIRAYLSMHVTGNDSIAERDAVLQRKILSFSKKRMMTFFCELDKLISEGVLSSSAIKLVVDRVGNHLNKPAVGVVNDYVGCIDEHNPQRKVTFNDETYWYVEGERKGSSIMGGLASVNKVLKIEANSSTFFAVKKIHYNEPDALDLVKRETKYLNFLNHSASAYADNENYFVLMPWIEGKVLSDITDEAMINISFHQRLLAFMPLLQVIEKLHHAGRVHGDIKPRNVIYEMPSILHLIDYNSAHREYTRKKHAFTIEYVDPYNGNPKHSKMVDDIFALSFIIRKIFPEVSNICRGELKEIIGLRYFMEYLITCEPHKRCVIDDVIHFFKFLNTLNESVNRAQLKAIIDELHEKPANAIDVLSGKSFRRTR